MIIMRSRGRLANQFFLFSAAREVARTDEWIVGVGFQELAGLVGKRPPRVLWLPAPHRFDRQVKTLFKWLKRLNYRLCRCASTSKGDLHKFRRARGCHWPLIFEFGGVQDSSLAPVHHVRILLSNALIGPNSWSPVVEKPRTTGRAPDAYAFCHVRLGDYLKVRINRKPIVLPTDFYSRGIRELRSVYPGIPVVVLSDDLNMARKMLSSESGLVYPALSVKESLKVMTNSVCGVISASTFSWWGAALASERNPGPFIAPKYWLGFASGVWEPSAAIKANFLTYRPVVSPSRLECQS